MKIISDEKDVFKNINTNGYLLIKNIEFNSAHNIVSSIGNIIDKTDVVVLDNSKSLVTSSKGLALHTDHAKAKFIAWYCIEPAVIGGETKLLDMKPLLETLSDVEINELKSINLKEHKVFDDDVGYTPIITSNNNIDYVYFSFWFVDGKQKENKTLVKFCNLIKNADYERIKLEKGDLLLIDNRRVLHGRTDISGKNCRNLKRFWIN